MATYAMGKSAAEINESHKNRLSEKTQTAICETLKSAGIDGGQAALFAAAIDVAEVARCGKFPILSNPEKDRRRKQYMQLKNALDRMDESAVKCLEEFLASAMWSKMDDDKRIPELPRITLKSAPYLTGELKRSVAIAVDETTAKKGIQTLSAQPEVLRRRLALRCIMDVWKWYIKHPVTASGEVKSPFEHVAHVILDKAKLNPPDDLKRDVNAAKKMPENRPISFSFFLDANLP